MTMTTQIVKKKIISVRRMPGSSLVKTSTRNFGNNKGKDDFKLSILLEK
jgi:hypothetical protein